MTPIPRTAIAAPFFIAGFIHCGTGVQRPSVTSQAAAPPQTQGDQIQAALIAGHWDLRSTGASPSSMRLELLFDSTAGSQFRARVVFLMQGNFGLDPSLFQPALGEIGPDSTVTLTFPPTAAPNRLRGRLKGDTITLTEFVWGGENQLSGGRTWLLVREKPPPPLEETRVSQLLEPIAPGLVRTLSPSGAGSPYRPPRARLRGRPLTAQHRTPPGGPPGRALEVPSLSHGTRLRSPDS